MPSPAVNILLEGLPRVGKTTLVQRLLSCPLFKFGGFYMQAVAQDAHRREFKLVTFEGRLRFPEERLVLRRFDLIGVLGLDIQQLETIGAQAIHRAITACDVVIIDEIGRHESQSFRFQNAVLEALDSRTPLVATTPLHGPPWIESLKNRPDVEVITVTEGNRLLLPDFIVTHLDAPGTELPAATTLTASA